MELNSENYFDLEMQRKYNHVSSYKSMFGTPFKVGCEAREIDRLNGKYIEESDSKALLVGTYVDIALTGTKEEMDKFIETNNVISTRGVTKGQLKSEYQQANVMIERVKRDKFMMKTLSGQKQVIMTGKIFDTDWAIKVDSLLDNAIVDLKTVQSIRKGYWDSKNAHYTSFPIYMGYDIQLAIYQEVVRQNIGKTLPCFLTCVSKETVPDIEVIQIDNDTLAETLESMKDNIIQMDLLKKGKAEPCKCGKCDYCRQRKVLKAPINYLELAGELD